MNQLVQSEMGAGPIPVKSSIDIQVILICMCRYFICFIINHIIMQEFIKLFLIKRLGFDNY